MPQCALCHMNKWCKYIDLARELKKLWNKKVMVIAIVIGTFCTVTKGLIQRLEDSEKRGQVRSIQITAFFRLARILRRVLEETYCHSNSSRKLSANTDVEKLSNE